MKSREINDEEFKTLLEVQLPKTIYYNNSNATPYHKIYLRLEANVIAFSKFLNSNNYDWYSYEEQNLTLFKIRSK